jgi:hypothetical protein
MAKRYTEELGHWVSERAAPRRRQDRNLVAFLAVKDDVQTALEAGYSMKTIWAHLFETGRIASRYETFTLHVKRHLRAPSPAGHPGALPVQPMAAAPAAASRAEPAPGGPRKTPPPSVGGFTFNATPKTEDLF